MPRDLTSETLLGDTVDYTIRELGAEEFYATFAAGMRQFFAGHWYLDSRDLLDSEALARLEPLKLPPYERRRILVGAFAGDEQVGWCETLQSGDDELIMKISGVLEAHRRRGLYSRMLAHVIEQATAAGFQRLTSFHHATNNGVIIPKLRAGFRIAGLEYKDNGGVMVKLQYLTDPIRRRLLEVRSGQRVPDADDLARLGISLPQT